MQSVEKNWWKVTKAWFIELLIACGLAVFSTGLYFQNRYHVFPLGRINYTALAVIVFVVGVHFINQWLVYPTWKDLFRFQRLEIFAIVLITTSIFAWIQPVPEPDVLRPFLLTIQAIEPDAASIRGSLVEIRELKYLNGKRIDFSQLSLTDDWTITDGILLSSGARDSKLEISGEAPVGVVIQFRYFETGGQAQVSWQGQTRLVDLSSKEDASVPLIFKADENNLSPSVPELARVWFAVLYLIGVGYLVLFLCVMIIRVAGKNAVKVLPGMLCLFILVATIHERAAYLDLDQPRTFRDSLAYVETAVQPINSPDFWMGTRAFTLPLFLKMLGTTPQNYQSVEQLMQIRDVQFVLSILSWTLLALALTLAFQNYWLKFAIFAVTLLFSTMLEISLWDSLLLSESISFSLLALTLASWVLLVVQLPRLEKPIFRVGLVGISVVAAVLYSFVRDSNIYFLIMGAAILVMGILINPHLPGSRRMGIAYLGLILVIFIVQNMSITRGNRWQIFIMDHLAMRILNNPQAVTFFEKEGLPLNDELMSTTGMVGYEYQQLMSTSPTMQPLREWIDCCGKQAYLKYLLSSPLETVLEPIDKWAVLVNGGNVEYRNPKYAFLELPDGISRFNEVFYPHQVWAVVFLGLVSLAGVIDYLLTKRQPLWIVVGILFITIYPTMFIVWHGEPLEIERHAAQIGIQWRLAGWWGLVMLVERMGMLLQR